MSCANAGWPAVPVLSRGGAVSCWGKAGRNLEQLSGTRDRWPQCTIFPALSAADHSSEVSPKCRFS